MAPEKKFLDLPRVVQLCAALLVLCQVLSAASATVKDDTSPDLWREKKCTFPTQLVMNQVETNCNKSKIDTDYTNGTQTWDFVTNVCQAILIISNNICRVPEETLEKNNLTETLINVYMGDDSVDVCGEDAGKAVTEMWAGFVADENTCKVVLAKDDMGKMLRLLYRLNWARKKLPPSSDVVWKSRFTAFKKSWDDMHCTFPPQWAMETDVIHTCENPPKEKPESEPWMYQKTLCIAFFNVTNSVCTDPDLRELSDGGDELKGLLDNDQFTVCDQADKLKSVSSDMVSDLSVLTAKTNMCTLMCVDDKHVTRVCKLLYFAITVPRFQHLQRLLQPVLSGGKADSATHATPADATPQTTTAHGDNKTTAPGDTFNRTTAPGDTLNRTTAPGDTLNRTTAHGDTFNSTTADGGTLNTTTADGETSGTTPEDEDQNPLARSLAGGLLSDSSGRIMMYIVVAICSVLLLYVVFYNRRRMLDCVLRRRESWQRHRDVEDEGGKYSPLDAAVEDFLSLDKAAVTKSKTHVY